MYSRMITGLDAKFRLTCSHVEKSIYVTYVSSITNCLLSSLRQTFFDCGIASQQCYIIIVLYCRAVGIAMLSFIIRAMQKKAGPRHSRNRSDADAFSYIAIYFFLQRLFLFLQLTNRVKTDQPLRPEKHQSNYGCYGAEKPLPGIG
uniref:Uncharacterized protein n=1 Tax=Glossina pallidipes TaxID=7398 RepID=A0A1A9Z2V7_GLOPL